MSMSETIKQVEAVPSQYPETGLYPRDLLEGDNPPDLAQVWQRIEAYIAYRYTARDVVWTIEGEGDWTPPLSPATIIAAEKWESGGWVEVSLPDGPYGYCLPSDGPYRVTASVGGGDVPAGVSDAVARLYEYTRGISEQFKNEVATFESGEMKSIVNANAKALQLSGAADLLRPYRRVK